ncbi:MAG: FGGY-family carbohydrate kinase [Pseudorhodobacter sp.]|nr:FGGY-family carbohydrate kinase [Pseudorhodobacter sp.]
MAAATLIGIDIGTTSVKAVMIGLDGSRVADSSTSYPTRHPAPGRVEQDPNDWLALVRDALARFAAHPEGRGVRAICLTSQVNTHVFVDAELQVLHPALVWQDGRAAAPGAALDAQISAADKIAWLGAPIAIDASHALARMAWMAAAHPDLWARTAHVLLPKDYVLAALTGQIAADPISAVGLVGADRRYAAPLIALLPGAQARLAPLADPLAVVGRVRTGEPLAGVPVVLGTMDAWASMFGLGVAAEGQAMYLSGTSEVLGLIARAVIPEPGVITFPEWAGITLHAGPTQAGGASLAWVAALLGREAAELAEAAAAITPQSPLFLPHLQGERAPLWDAQARGTFAGLASATGPAELAAAVLEGVAFSARLALEALQRSAGQVPGSLHCGGGGAASDRWCQIRANVLGRPLHRMQGRDPGAVGAAVMAGVGSGAMSGLAQAAGHLVQLDRSFQPDPAAARLADARFALWQQLYRQVRPINAGLA